MVSVGMEKPEVVEQVDLTPTLALGLGLPISQNSVGRLIPGVLEETSLRDQLRFLHLNGHQLSCLLKDSTPDYEKGGSRILPSPTSGLVRAREAGTSSDGVSSLCEVVQCLLIQWLSFPNEQMQCDCGSFSILSIN